MQIVNVTKSMTLMTGSAPILYFMIALSVISMAICLERAWFFESMRDDIEGLARDLKVPREAAP